MALAGPIKIQYCYYGPIIPCRILSKYRPINVWFASVLPIL